MDDEGGNPGPPALHAGESMLLGAVAGGLSAVATHPIDTIKSNMQALGGGAYVCRGGGGGDVGVGVDVTSW